MTTVLTAPAPPPLNCSEKDFQQLVVDYATVLGYAVYHTYDSRRSDPGFPDLFLARPRPACDGRVLLVELKTTRGRLRPEQRAWELVLRSCPGIEYYFWRPADWTEVCEVLT